mmetsp:Transcript_33/g.80  ORF Transcript_33/g.80 Transcript_33/m.80 type:complete len:297 (-) Transcript_33:553-1443(-)|eukprot:CAMPEP_0168178596 /NCGR_PEP_ID=MMETSP0139_2-20121125/9254_1 /TAXON_ID=44445 /ORGANISM="Pseudo-nitzschia australis, Strain 10249 10 AB" /LENGTH=296 /DNA_ID=CAMNT_0008098089 /DNA_START=24 /DNA_END=914 /DNA_ORIENTATION=+
MPRGKNYANNQRGVHLQCKLAGGSAECIYRHDEPSKRSSNSTGKTDVCIPFLAGKCTFEKGCRKRHPSKNELPRLLAKYKKTRCRFGDECYTEGCLFLHPKEEKAREPHFISPHNFPPLSNCGSIDSKQATVAPTDSAWNKNLPSVAADVAANRVSPSPSSQQIEDGSLPLDQQQGEGLPRQLPAAWGPPPPMMMMNNGPMQQLPPVPPPPQGYYGGPPPPMMLPNMVHPIIDPNTGYPVDPSVAAYYYEQQQHYFYQQQRMVPPYPMAAGVDNYGPPMGSPFNVEAKEFIPGMSA